MKVPLAAVFPWTPVTVTRVPVVSPWLAETASGRSHGQNVVGYRNYPDDIVQAFARLDQGVAAGLFESVIGGEKVGRYSFVASDPSTCL